MMKPYNFDNSFEQIYEELRKDKKIWDFFTKNEEYNPTKLDKHGRFSNKDSRYKKNVLNPLVSEFLIRKGFHSEYPNDKKFAVLLSHDVDDLYVQLKHLLFSFYYFPRNRNVRDIYNLIKGLYNKKKSPYLNLKKIVEIEKQYDATSSFYFLTSEKDIFGTKYKLEEEKEYLEYILDNGSEIGYHTGYYVYDNLGKIKKEKEKMEKIIGERVVGVRNHVMRFKIPDSWEILAKAGFEYDSTYGYYDSIGFRNGMCHPFLPFNLNTDKKINILEIPINIQDWTLFMFMKFDVKDSWTYIKDLIDKTEKIGGVLTILWHNWSFSYPTSIGAIFKKEWAELYEKILNYASQKNAWLTSCKELNDYQKKNGILKR